MEPKRTGKTLVEELPVAGVVLCVVVARNAGDVLAVRPDARPERRAKPVGDTIAMALHVPLDALRHVRQRPTLPLVLVIATLLHIASHYRRRQGKQKVSMNSPNQRVWHAHALSVKRCSKAFSVSPMPSSVLSMPS